MLHFPSCSAARRGALGLAAVLALTASIASSAHAGRYVYRTCGDAAVSDGSAGWTQFNGSAWGPGVKNGNYCPSNGLYSEMQPVRSSLLPIGAGLGWQFTAPAYTYVQAVSFILTGWVSPPSDVTGGNHTRGSITVLAPSQGQIGYWDSSKNPLLSPTPAFFSRNDLHDSDLTVTLACHGDLPNEDPGCAGPFFSGWMQIFLPSVTLVDDDAPTAGAISGTMVFDTQLNGPETLHYRADDMGGGISRFRLYVDGDLVQDQNLSGGSCNPVTTEGGMWVFSKVQPCPSSVSENASLATDSLTDGPHVITATVVDAAQQDTTVFSAVRTVVNHPPVSATAPSWADPAAAVAVKVGDTLTAKTGVWTGQSLAYVNAWQACDADGAHCVTVPDGTGMSYTVTADDAGHRLRFVQTASNVAGTVTAASTTSSLVPAPPIVVPPTTDGGGGSASGGGSVPDGTTDHQGADGSNGPDGTSGVSGVSGVSGTSTVAQSFLSPASGTSCPKHTAKLTQMHISGGRLKLGNGKAGEVTVLVTCAQTGKAIGGAHLDVTTTISGRPVASQIVTDGDGLATFDLPKGPSRSITIGYRSSSDDPVVRATTTVKVSVPARVSVKARKKTVRNGDPVQLTGKLTGGYLPERGVVLDVQRMDHGHWRTFAHTRAKGSEGAFSFEHRLARANHPAQYRLRVTIAKEQVSYPYTPASSRTVKVTVKP